MVTLAFNQETCYLTIDWFPSKQIWQHYCHCKTEVQTEYIPIRSILACEEIKIRSRLGTTLSIISISITAGHAGGRGGLRLQYGADPGGEDVQPGVDPRELSGAPVAVAHYPDLGESSLLLDKERPPRVPLATVLAWSGSTECDVVVPEGDQVTLISRLAWRPEREIVVAEWTLEFRDPHKDRKHCDTVEAQKESGWVGSLCYLCHRVTAKGKKYPQSGLWVAWAVS